MGGRDRGEKYGWTGSGGKGTGEWRGFSGREGWEGGGFLKADMDGLFSISLLPPSSLSLSLSLTLR